MTTAQCLKACRKLSDKHSFIVTERAHACCHSDGSVTITTDHQIAVFKNGDIVHLTENHQTHAAAFANVRAYFHTLNTTRP